MKKGLLKLETMGDYEKEKGFASYRTIVDYFIGDIVLCNNIIDIDTSIYDNMTNGYKYIDYETREEKTQEDCYNDNNGRIEVEYEEIYQFYVCNISEWNKKTLEEMGIILSYSNMLDCDVLCVDHWGTSWDYVLTNVKLFDSYEELEKYESGN